MGMSMGGSSGEEGEVQPTMNTTPLIDVLLVLLVMLIITIPIQTHAVKLDMPVGTPPPSTVQPEVIRIDVDFDGTWLWNGEVVPDRATLEAKLQQVALTPDQPEVHLRPHKLSVYGSVATVLASAQRLGVEKIGIVGNEQFVND